MDATANNLGLGRWTPWASGCVFHQRADLTFERISPRVADWTGVPAERWRREPGLFFQAIAPADAEQVRRQIARAAAAPEGVSQVFHLQHAQTGRLTRLGEFRCALLDGQGKVQGYDGFWLDLSLWTAAGQRLAAASWKEALSAITLGVVHDFNNALTGVLSLSDHLFSQTDAQHPFREGLALIRQNSVQAAQLARQLMHLHHDQGGKRELRDLNQLTAEMTELLRRFIPKRIAVASELAAGQLPVEVDGLELQRAIIYLAQNAAEAIAQRGAIHLQTSRHSSPPELRHFTGRPPGGPTACLAVTDTGIGIEEEHLGRIFDPFFTTKPPETGSGLGLYHASRFAETHGGALSVESAPGHGTTLRLWLPLVDLDQ